MDMDDAYAVQGAWVRKKIAAGREPTGWKIGLTSKAMQYALNIDVPDSGVLFDDMSFEDGATVPADRFIQPRIEAEIAFVMKAPLRGPHISVFDVLNATDHVTPALEILDTRILRVDPQTKKARTIVDTISDNAANAGIVTGPTRSTCAGWARSSAAMLKSRKPVSARASSISPRAALRGSPIAWPGMVTPSRLARSYLQGRSFVRSRHGTATRSTPISAGGER
jgi:2-keto-4-pentenoate hydratase